MKFLKPRGFMVKISHAALIAISGLVWFLVGIYLLPLGIHFLIENAHTDGPLMGLFASFDLEQVALVLVGAGLVIGYLKGKHVFAKAVEKNVTRIRALPNPSSLLSIYTPRYLILLGAMMLLGLSMKWLSVPLDVRGLIDVAVGSALINGGVLYFRRAYEVRSQAL